jgi:predicted secreted Zn-dependent protease
MEHERGHALISVRTASELARDLDGMTRPRCDPLSALADTTKARRIRENQSKQQDYDRATRHGATQIEQAGRLRSP